MLSRPSKKNIWQHCSLTGIFNWNFHKTSLGGRLYVIPHNSKKKYWPVQFDQEFDNITKYFNWNFHKTSLGGRLYVIPHNSKKYFLTMAASPRWVHSVDHKATDSPEVVLDELRLLWREEHSVLVFRTWIIRVREISHFLARARSRSRKLAENEILRQRKRFRWCCNTCH